MGGAVSHFFQSGSALLTVGNHRGCSDATRARVRMVFDVLRANPRVTVQRLEGLLSQIPKSENVLVVHNEEGYNLLQKVVAINNVDMLRWILSRNTDLNRGACSFPLHIACLRGHEDCVELLLKHGARVDVEARMCWPGPHNQNCEERGKYCKCTLEVAGMGHHGGWGGRSSRVISLNLTARVIAQQVGWNACPLLMQHLCNKQNGYLSVVHPAQGGTVSAYYMNTIHVIFPTIVYCLLTGIDDDTSADRSSDKLQSAICYAIDGDQVDILELLMQQTEDHWLPWQQKRPLLHIACERGAWNCVKYLVSERSEEINQCYDEYYPIHQAALQPAKFLEILIQNGADINVCTQTEQLTLLHLVFLLGRKSTEDTLNTCKLLLDSGLRELINRPDSLGNTPLHGLIVRYALEEARYPYDSDIQPWNKWDVLHIARYLLRNGASPSINQQGNSALACVLRHVRDWEFRYEMLNMLLQAGGDPNIVGRDGSVPLMVCLVPLINKDPLHHFTHTMKVCYLNCVRILLKHGANPNCTSRSNLTPLHVLVFSASETMALGRDADQNMEFIRSLLVLLLQHGLDTNIRISQRTQHILQALLDMVHSSRQPTELHHVYDLTLTFLQSWERFGLVHLQESKNPNCCWVCEVRR
ncbi:hypothetical protein J6590_050766 [Homalodisca vitripennis]|nr:hypothetical protein J6590_050766 [Homalodisca vitripennis]